MEEIRFCPVSERNFQECPKCGKKMTRPIRENDCRVDNWKPRFYENIEEKPIYFETRKERDDCLKRKGFTLDK